MSIKYIVIFFAILTALSAITATKILYEQNQKLKTEKAILEAANVEAVKQANKFINRPRSANDIDKRLCERARAAEQSENPTIKRLPVRPCP